MSKVSFYYGLFLFLLFQMSVSKSQGYCGSLPQYTDVFWLQSMNVLGDQTFTTFESIRFIDQDIPGGSSILIDDPIVELSSLSSSFELNPGSMPFLVGWTVNWQIWIDVNENGVYDSNERFYQGSGPGQIMTQVDLSQYQFNGAINTRMRLMVSYDEWPEPCDQLLYGDVRDFHVEILAPQPVYRNVPAQYTTIQAAIDAAVDGDHIVVNDGVYDEHLVINKRITLESVNGADHTTITGSLGFHTIWVQAPEVTIQGFDLSGQRGIDLAGIYFDQGADYGSVYSSDCGTNPNGVIDEYNVLVTDADHINVSGLECLNRGRSGIYVNGTNHSSFSNNQLMGSNFEGIYLSNAYETNLLNNVTTDNGRTGIVVTFSERTSVKLNDCSHNVNQTTPPFTTSRGIRVSDSFGTELEANTCNNNPGTGISVSFSEDTLLQANELLGNDKTGVRTYRSLNTEVYGNTFQNSFRGLEMVELNTETSIINNQFYDNQIGLDVNFVNGSLIQGNTFKDNSNSMTLNGVKNSAIRENQFDPLSLSSDSCKIDLSGSRNNHVYLNNFNFYYSTFYRKICGDNGNNQWFSPHSISYRFNGLDYDSPMGNFYIWVDHTDLFGDGIVDTATVLEFGAVDNYSLTLDYLTYQF